MFGSTIEEFAVMLRTIVLFDAMGENKNYTIIEGVNP